MNDKAKKVSVFNEINTVGINVGLDEVVSIFVSKYEDNLYAEKERIEDALKEVATRQNANKTAILASRQNDMDAFISTVSTTGPIVFNVTVGKPQVVIDDDEQVVNYCVELDAHFVGDPRKNTGYGRQNITLKKSFDIPAALVAERNTNKAEKASLENALMVVLGNINDISRKERKVRGEISARKLEEAGLNDLLQDAGMLKLVQLD